MFTRIGIRGYKSFRDRVQADLKPLTILAGANSSGKSSLIQPLLLFKQTLLSSSDPGPLRLDGPNVVFSRSEQMFWQAPGDRADNFEIEVEMQSPRGKKLIGTRVVFRRRKEPRGLPSLQIERTTWTLGEQTFDFTPKTSAEELKRFFMDSLEIYKPFFSQFSEEREQSQEEDFKLHIAVIRQRCFLVGVAQLQGIEVFRLPVEVPVLEESLRRVIHVPGLRGNPERAYPVRAVGNDFPGLFQDYVASLIARWQRQQKDKWETLNHFLGDMGLTWKVRAYQRSDTEVELQVGRTSRSLRGGARDLVNIADVGFGLSQSLPILVALIAAEPGQLVYLEQPEIHLHPEAQVILADVISWAVQEGVQVVVETHSHLLLLAFQRAIAKGDLSPTQVILHWFQRDEQGGTNISTTTFKKNGSYENPQIPVDFANVSMKLMREYLEASE